MDFQVKLFSWEDKGNHLIIIGRGPMDIGALDRLFAEIAAATRPLPHCKVLADLSDGAYEFDAAEVDAFVRAIPSDGWPPGNRVALVSGPRSEDYHQLCLLRGVLARHGLSAGVFREAKAAIDWLAGMF